MRPWFRVTLIPVLSLVATRAGAAAPAPADEERGPSERLQVLTGDLTAAALIGAAFEVEREAHQGSSSRFTTEGALLLAGLGGYLLTGPILHATRKSVGRTSGAFLLRAIFPVMGGVLGEAAGGCAIDADTCRVRAITVGAISGAILASAIDIVLLSAPGRGLATPASRAEAVSLAPRIAVTSQMAFAGVGGQF